MSTEEDIVRLLDEFLAGRQPFDGLVTQLRTVCGADGAADDVLQAVLQNTINNGQLPYDLAILVWRETTQANGSPESADAVSADEVPMPVTSENGGASVDPGAIVQQEKVDDVVISALLDGFRSYRQQTRPLVAKTDDDKHLDAALSEFRGARFRRDATMAEAGRPRQQGTIGGWSGASARVVGIGSMLRDRFVLDRELGRGGMGIVYRAVDRRRLEAMHQSPYVALKLLSGSFKEHPDALRTLESEARKAQELAHPNIVTVFDFDRDGGEVFIVMELLQGAPLDGVIERLGREGLNPQVGRRIVQGLSDGLAYAHERGIVHADIKPANVFIMTDGQVKILDFGIASAVRAGAFDAGSLGAFTAAYASPEMEDGAPRDPRDDVYALGCVAYMAFSGEHPFDRLSGAEVRSRGLRPQKLRDIAGHEWHAIAQALSMERDARQPNAGAFSVQFRGGV